MKKIGRVVIGLSMLLLIILLVPVAIAIEVTKSVNGAVEKWFNYVSDEISSILYVISQW